MTDSRKIDSSRLKRLCVDSADGSVDFTRFSQLTWDTLAFMLNHPEPQSPQNIAQNVKAPSNTVQKTLTRLYKMNMVKKFCRGFYEVNHDFFINMGNFSTYTKMGGGWGVHCVLLSGGCDGLFSKLLEWGTLVPYDLRNIGTVYKGSSLVYDGMLRLFPGSAHYQRACVPVAFESLGLMYEDFVKSLAFLSGGLAVLDDVRVKTFELGVDHFPCGDLFGHGLRRIEFYREKRREGECRIHGLYNVDESFPAVLGKEREFRDLWAGDMVKAVGVVEKAVETFASKVRDDDASFVQVIRSLWSDKEWNQMMIERVSQKLRDEYVPSDDFWLHGPVPLELAFQRYNMAEGSVR